MPNNKYFIKYKALAVNLKVPGGKKSFELHEHVVSEKEIQTKDITIISAFENEDFSFNTSFFHVVI